MDTVDIAVEKHTGEPSTNDRNEESSSQSNSPLGPSKRKKSWVWDHFKAVEGQSNIVCCILCSNHINYGSSRSTGMLERHIRRHHPKVHTDILVQRANDKQQLDIAKEKVSSQGKMTSFVIGTPDFEQCFLDWMIQSYQPLSACESESFRAMCKSLNKKAPVIARERVGRLLQTKFHEVQTKMKHILKGRWYALTTDAWTSLAKVGYVTCTVHFIDDKTWKLHSLVLGLFEKSGRSRAVDCVGYVEQQMHEYGLLYRHLTAVVTDTEATMVAAGRLFVQHSIDLGGASNWHGCVDHQLELVTGLAFDDTPETLGTMAACRALVNYFNSSPQATTKLLAKQQEGRAVKPIQDVSTRWWSTFSMVKRLIRLKAYFTVLDDEGELDFKNLSVEQWSILNDVKVVLEPFMIVQRLLEGQHYVTISLVPYMIYKVRKGLHDIVQNVNTPQHIVVTVQKMLDKLNEIFGSGIEGTVATENLMERVRRRPKGIPVLTLMASFMDPRMKGGVGLSALDKEEIWGFIRDEVFRITFEQQQHIQVHHEQQNDERVADNLDNHQHDALDNMLDELNEHYLEEARSRNGNNDILQLDNLQQDGDNPDVGGRLHEQVMASVDAELTLFKQEPSIPFKIAGKLSCPLEWWFSKKEKYKLLAQLALRILCIPATSAPSERVFSVAGLTIAKDRARLASQTANELLFLHDAIPAMKRFEESLI